MSPDQPSTSQVPDSILGRHAATDESLVLLKNRMNHPFLTQNFASTPTMLRKPGKRKSPLDCERLSWTSKQHITEERIATSMRDLSLEPRQHHSGEVTMKEADLAISNQRPLDEGFCEDNNFDMNNGEILDRLPKGTGPIFNIAPDLEQSISKLLSSNILPETILEAIKHKPCTALVLYKPLSKSGTDSSQKLENNDVTKEKIKYTSKAKPTDSVQYEDMCVESWESDDDDNDILMLGE